MRLSGRFLAGAAVALAVLAVDAGPVRWAKRSRAAKGPVTSEDALFYAATAPVPLLRMVPESSPASALVVALPDGQVIGNPRKEAFFIRLIEAATDYVPVTILVSRDQPYAIVQVRELVRLRARHPDRVLGRIAFVRALIDSEWVRDYGPLFGLSHDSAGASELVLLDNMYRDVRSEAATERMLDGLGFVKRAEGPSAGSGGGGEGPYLSDYGTFWRRNDDAAPLYFNEIVDAERHQYGVLVRTPLQLSGGDLAFSEDGQLFTSTRALEANGGDVRRFSRLARDYFGAWRVNFLRPLPQSIWHLDMFVKFAGPGVVLLAELTDTARRDSDYLRLLSHEAAEALEWNRARLAERLPGVEVIRVPMPPIVLAGIGGLTESGRTGLAELDWAVAQRGLHVKALAPVLYRSFLNSVYLNGGDGPSAVLVPRYSGFEALEPAVSRAYRRAYPGAEIRFIESDIMAEEFGGIHCVTVTIPAPRPALRD